MSSKIKVYTIENSFIKLDILNLGATIYKLIIKPLNRNVVLTCHNLQDYLSDENKYIGATIGRVAGRIKNAQYEYLGKIVELDKNFENNKHSGHGGYHGLHQSYFDVLIHEKDFITLKYTSLDLESKYPGKLELTITYRLIENRLVIFFDGILDQESPLNITNHSYFNLSGEDTIFNHELYANFDAYQELDNERIATGNIIGVSGTILDFNKGKKLRNIILDPSLQNPKTMGLDHAFYFKKPLKFVLSVPDLELNINTTYPLIQTYTSGYPAKIVLENNKVMKQYQGFAIEPQYEIDAVNHKHFSNIIFGPNRDYQESISYEFNIKMNL